MHNDNIASPYYKQYNHTSNDHTVTPVDTERYYNKLLRLEEALDDTTRHNVP